MKKIYRFVLLTVTSLFVLTAPALKNHAFALNVQSVVSPGGITAWLVRDTTNPIITVNLTFRGGTALDPVGKEGLANLVSGLIDEGAGDLDSQAFQQTLEDLAIKLRFSASKDTFGGRLQTLVKNKETAFDLLRLALSEPRFDANPVEKIRQQILVGLKRDQEDPHSIGARKLFETLFPNHPYGRPSDGTIDTVRALTTDDMKGFMKRRIGRDNLVVGVVGDISVTELGTLLDKTFGKLPKSSAPWNIPDVTPAKPGRTIVINKAVPQSAIQFAQQGLKREDPDFYAAYVMNHIFGAGSFTSRLYEEVREKRGLVYSVGTSLYPFDAGALIFGSAGTANERAGETISVLKEQWIKMATEGANKKELDDSKTFLTGSFPLRFSSSGRIASILVGMQLSDLGIDYLDKRNSFINAVTLDDIKRVAAKLLNYKNLVTVIVGEPKGVNNTN
jgi:zinc protease